MDAMIHTLLALVAALNVLAGTPSNPGSMPDRPAIVQSVPAAPAVSQKNKEVESVKIETPEAKPASSSVEIKGAITNIQGKVITVNGQKITLGSNVEIKGQLKVGAAVQVEAVKVNGNLTASEIEVRNAGKETETPEPKLTVEAKHTPEAKETPEVKSNDNSKSGTEVKSNDKSDDKKDDQSQDKPEDKSKDQEKEDGGDHK